MEFSRQEYWNGLPFPSPGDLPNPGIEPKSPALQEPLGKTKKKEQAYGAKQDFPRGADGKASAYHEGDPDSTPGLGRSPGEGNGNPLQYSCLESPMDSGTW